MGSEVDFESLVREHHAALYRFAFSMTRHEADAADLVQETFLRWAEKGHQLANPAAAKSWLFTTLYRAAIHRGRRIVRFPSQTLEDSEGELPDLPSLAPDAADGSLVLEALDRIDDTFRAAVALFYLRDHTHPEIAEILGIPVGTVKSRIARGIGQLQRILAARRPSPKPGSEVIS